MIENKTSTIVFTFGRLKPTLVLRLAMTWLSFFVIARKSLIFAAIYINFLYINTKKQASSDTCFLDLLQELLFFQNCLSSCKSCLRNSERRARNVVQTNSVAELNRIRIAAVFAAYSANQLRINFLTFFH